MDLVNKPIGSEGSLDIKLVDGKIVVSVSHDHSSGKVSLVVEESVGYFLEKLKSAIPGQIDDVVIDGLKGAFGL